MDDEHYDSGVGRAARFAIVAAVHAALLWGGVRLHNILDDNHARQKREFSSEWQDMVDDALIATEKNPELRATGVTVIRSTNDLKSKEIRIVQIDFAPDRNLVTMQEGLRRKPETYRVVVPENGLLLPKGFHVQAAPLQEAVVAEKLTTNSGRGTIAERFATRLPEGERGR